MLRITLTKGLVGKRDDQKKVVRALGLGKFNSSVLHADTPTIRGMVNKVHHLVTVVEDKDDSKAKASETKAKAKKTEAKAEKA